jgi:PAS domain S-box-containing protein
MDAKGELDWEARQEGQSRTCRPIGRPLGEDHIRRRDPCQQSRHTTRRLSASRNPLPLGRADVVGSTPRKEEAVDALGLGLLVAVLAGLSGWLTWDRDTRPSVLWTRGWVFLFVAGATAALGGGTPSADAVVRLLGPFFPALMLAGALVHAGRRVPVWLVPLAFLLGTLRLGSGGAGYHDLGYGIALVFESGAPLAAAFLAFRTARRGSGSTAQHLLAMAFLAIAAIEALNSIWGLRGHALTPPHLLAWVLVGPFAVGVQIAVSRERVLGLQQRVERALSESETRFRALTDNAFDLVAEMNREGIFTYTNPRYEEWLGVPGGELMGTHALELVHPEDRERILAWFRNIYRLGEESLLTVRLRHRDGGWRWAENSGRALHVGGELRIVANTRDVTERMELGAELQRSHDQLEERVAERTAQLHTALASLEKEAAERRRLEIHMQEAQKLESLGVLAGGVAHDFNNLLAVILGNVGLALSEAQHGTRLAGQLERARTAAKHAEALTGQMLTYSGKASVSLEPLDLSELVRSMSGLLEASISSKCRLETLLERGPTWVEGDPTQLRQVVINLVTNASEALGEHPGRVGLCTGLMTADADYLADTLGSAGLETGDYVYLEVSDSGAGIDEETRKRIFEPFFSTKFTGRGLGLASVLGIVRGHGGAIKLVTEPSKQTCFRVLLPPAARSARPAFETPREPSREMRGGRILVVDDAEPVLEVAREFLERAGFDVVTAGGGREALEILHADAERRIDAAVLDLAMPDLDGRETLLELRSLRPGLPVVMVSGFREDANTGRFAGESTAAFVRKPYEPEELIEAVRAALADRSEPGATASTGTDVAL